MTKTSGNWGKGYFPPALLLFRPATSSPLLLELLMLPGREGGERGDGGQTSFPLLLFICFFLSPPPPPPGEYVCSQLPVGGGREGGEVGIGTTIYGVCFFLNERGGNHSSAPYPSPHFCFERGIPHYDIRGDLCTTQKRRGKFILPPFPSSSSTSSSNPHFPPIHRRSLPPPWTGCVCPFVTRSEGRRGERGKGMPSFSFQPPSYLTQGNISLRHMG